MTRRPRPAARPAVSASRPPGDAALTDPVKARYAQYAQQAGRWIQGYEARGGQVHCGAGCFRCCDMPIRVSLAEALITAQALGPDERHRVARHAAQVQDNARTAPDDETYVQRHRRDIGFCPLLDRGSGACTQYAARPTRCRDTYSAFPASYCAEGRWEQMTRRERDQYRRDVARTPGTDGEVHFIAPLEHLSEPVWQTASKAMRREWGLEVWGDFWTLTTLAADPAFMARIRAADRRGAQTRARQLRLAQPITLEFGSQDSVGLIP